jgi:hypothetical protein
MDDQAFDELKMRMTMVRQQAACRRRSCNDFSLRLVQNIGQASRPNLNQQPSMQFGTEPV